MTDGITWSEITDRAAARELEHFACTTNHPRTPGGRKLPHPRQWEWDVQRYLRTASHWYRTGDVLLIGHDVNGAVAAAAHLMIDQGDALLEVFIAALAVAHTHRDKGGAVADETFRRIKATAVAVARERGLPAAILTGKIHRNNRASQYLALRHGQEPVGVPSEDYGLWCLHLALE